jgi:hypothetical protein
MSYEWFEYEQEARQWAKIPPLTPENLKTIERHRWESLNALYNKYLHGGSSPRKTYLHFAQNYVDVDTGYGSFCNE